MKCPYCSQNIPKDALSCNYCGKSIYEHSSVKEETFQGNSVLEEPDISQKNEEKLEDSQPHICAAIPNEVSSPEEIKKKFEENEEKGGKSYIGCLVIILILGAVRIGIKMYTNHVEEQYRPMIEKYAKDNMGIDFSQTNNKPARSSHSTKNTNVVILEEKEEVSSEEQIRLEIENLTDEIFFDLPKTIGKDLDMLHCEVADGAVVFRIQWEYMAPSDFTPEASAKFKKFFIDTFIKRKGEKQIKRLLDKMKQHEYKFLYLFVDECKEELGTIKILPSEIK